MSGQMVQVNCRACGKPTTVRLADYKRGWGKFCDKSCAAAYRCGQRPRDVNADHAKFSVWAYACMQDRIAAGLAAGGKWPICPPVNEQIGKRRTVRVKPYQRTNAPVDKRVNYETELDADFDDMPEGWDGHKDWCGS